ncbi:MAG: glyceraldehyde 3-phosphate dehydrogenase NAD-binding domain-containing protein [Candidatus Brocadiia bacterium]
MHGALGINGLGRIGKLTLWHHVARRRFDRIVINIGRMAGHGLADVADYICHDSTYGTLAAYLEGHKGATTFEVVSEQNGELLIHGMPVKILRSARDPRSIGWRNEGVSLVIETTGKFADPSKPEDEKNGSLRGHLAAGAEVVLLSSAFKVPSKGLPEDSAFMIYGINHSAFKATSHKIISAASCTTTALAHMMQPLLNERTTARLITAGMSTVHATTKTQSILDDVPDASAKDMRRNRSVMNNIVLTSTNAAAALEWVMPEIKSIGFMADSVRVPTDTVSIILLNVTFQTEMTPDGRSSVTRESINEIYSHAAETYPPKLIEFTNRQNVSSDLKGRDVAVTIEGCETHTRTGFLKIMVPNGNDGPRLHEIPVTHAKIFGWYDNELGSYSNRLGDLTCYVADNL